MKRILFLITLFSSIVVSAQDTLPIIALKGNDTSKPLIFYISGDGGLTNSFSSSFTKKFNQHGYSVVGLDAKKYFWDKKKPKQASDDVSKLLMKYMKEWNCKSFVLIGYSFGADVSPFIETRFPRNISEQLKHTILMSPSKKTDFEIHLLGMLGLGGSSGESVPDEINKLTRPTTLIFGDDENDFPVKSITSKKIDTIKLPGGHHYDGNVDEVIEVIMGRIR